ncbi:MAG: ISLre2 family transposase, partial [Halanaerobiaceae bacterium]|nr:ISLre2 family transposase [Halanaerobiaceae bacterium]
MWLEVIDYIDEHYDLDNIETIYLAGDGPSWIREGLNWLPCSRYVLDRYHLNKYVLRATGHIPGKRP